MKRLLPLFFVLTACAAEPGFHSLFNGKDLKGWEGDPRVWKVDKGEILGNTDGIELKDNTFLIYTPKEFGNFVLRAEMKLRNHNSGIQFRSERLPNFVVRGYQADAAEDNWWGGIYEEKGKRGVMVEAWKGKAEKIVKKGDWNEYEISCQGDHIVLKLNGVQTADLHDSEKLKGIIALQVHRGPGMEVRFRNIRIKELP